MSLNELAQLVDGGFKFGVKLTALWSFTAGNCWCPKSKYSSRTYWWGWGADDSGCHRCVCSGCRLWVLGYNSAREALVIRNKHYTPDSSQSIPISLWDSIFNTRHYTLMHGFCFFQLISIGCIGLTNAHVHVHVYSHCHLRRTKHTNSPHRTHSDLTSTQSTRLPLQTVHVRPSFVKKLFVKQETL